MQPVRDDRPSRFRFFTAWLVTFVFLGLLIEAWSLATPIDAAPDDASQMIKAAATVRGQWIGSPEPPPAFKADSRVEVPAEVAFPDHTECFQRHPERPAGCEIVSNFRSTKTVGATTYMGHYPPLYYLLVGWPTLLTGGSRSLYLMRAASAVLNAAILALAFAAVYRWSRAPLLLPALSIAVTPMTLFLSSVVNPSGLEITSAVTMWTAATILVVEYPSAAPTGLVGVLGGATTVLVLVRGLSPLWPVVCVVVLLPMLWRRRVVGALLTRRVVRAWGVVIVVAALTALAWVVLAHGLTVKPLAVPPAGTSWATIARDVAGQERVLITEAIGLFGWTDTPVPLLTYFIWIGAGSCLVLLGALSGSRRGVAALVAAMTAGAVLPYVIAVATARRDGLIEQARYFLPLEVAIPILAGAIATRAFLPAGSLERVARAVVYLGAAGQAAAAVWALRRYLVGIDGPLSPTAVVAGGWRPPLPGWALDVVFVVVPLTAAAVAVRWGLDRPRTDPADAGRGVPRSSSAAG